MVGWLPVLFRRYALVADEPFCSLKLLTSFNLAKTKQFDYVILLKYSVFELHHPNKVVLKS